MRDDVLRAVARELGVPRGLSEEDARSELVRRMDADPDRAYEMFRVAMRRHTAALEHAGRLRQLDAYLALALAPTPGFAPFHSAARGVG